MGQNDKLLFYIGTSWNLGAFEYINKMSEKNKNSSSNVEQMKEYQQAVSMEALQHLVSNLEKRQNMRWYFVRCRTFYSIILRRENICT
jgi:hypothetical protein